MRQHGPGLVRRGASLLLRGSAEGKLSGSSGQGLPAAVRVEVSNLPSRLRVLRRGGLRAVRWRPRLFRGLTWALVAGVALAAHGAEPTRSVSIQPLNMLYWPVLSSDGDALASTLVLQLPLVLTLDEQKRASGSSKPRGAISSLTVATGRTQPKDGCHVAPIVRHSSVQQAAHIGRRAGDSSSFPRSCSSSRLKVRRERPRERIRQCRCCELLKFSRPSVSTSVRRSDSNDGASRS